MMTSPNAERCNYCPHPKHGKGCQPCRDSGVLVGGRIVDCNVFNPDFLDLGPFDNKPVRPLSAVLDALDAKLAEMTSGEWKAHQSTGHAPKVWKVDAGEEADIVTCWPAGNLRYVDSSTEGYVKLEADDFPATANATGIALIRNMAASLSAAVRAAEAVHPQCTRKEWTELDDALNAVVAAAEETR